MRKFERSMSSKERTIYVEPDVAVCVTHRLFTPSLHSVFTRRHLGLAVSSIVAAFGRLRSDGNVSCESRLFRGILLVVLPTVMPDDGGHFAGRQQPQLFSEKVRAAFRSLCSVAGGPSTTSEKAERGKP
jgi:hypothetical protein